MVAIQLFVVAMSCILGAMALLDVLHSMGIL
jgi:hypothetical protein